MRSKKRTQDLIVFLAVLTVGTILALYDAQSSLLATVSVIVTGLYTDLRGNRRGRGKETRRKGQRGARPD
ncbi:hypothetical protein [Streptomyces sp. NPDC005525]|uniref:hypothetical protein n=1 Tax=Streptomyces sp. NPDC005525 TaxID=3364720 RepID=UPI0036743BD7